MYIKLFPIYLFNKTRIARRRMRRRKKRRRVGGYIYIYSVSGNSGAPDSVLVLTYITCIVKISMSNGQFSHINLIQPCLSQDFSSLLQSIGHNLSLGNEFKVIFIYFIWWIVPFFSISRNNFLLDNDNEVHLCLYLYLIFDKLWKN